MALVISLDVAELAATRFATSPTGRDDPGASSARQARPARGELALVALGAGSAGPAAAAGSAAVAARRHRPVDLPGVPHPGARGPVAGLRGRAGPGGGDARPGGPGQPAPGVRRRPVAVQRGRAVRAPGVRAEIGRDTSE